MAVETHVLGEVAVMAEQVAQRLVARGETLGVAESSSGGLVAAALLATPGASRFFMGGGVIYTGTAREALLGITPTAMEGLQPATEPYAALLARSVRFRLSTTWGVGETGAAGPTGNRYGDPPGHGCVAAFGPHEIRRTVTTGAADRSANMQAFALALLTVLNEALSLT